MLPAEFPEADYAESEWKQLFGLDWGRFDVKSPAIACCFALQGRKNKSLYFQNYPKRVLLLYFSLPSIQSVKLVLCLFQNFPQVPGMPDKSAVEGPGLFVGALVYLEVALNY